MLPRNGIVALGLCFSLSPWSASAQTPGEQELLRERQERVLQEQQRRLQELQQLPGRRAEAPAAPTSADERRRALLRHRTDRDQRRQPALRG